MAVFKKMLGGRKGREKPKLEIAAAADALAGSDELEQRKRAWQEELEEKSDFLSLELPLDQPEVESAAIQERDGLPVLRAFFDVHHFQAKDVQLEVVGQELFLEARGSEESNDAGYQRTLLRRLALPDQAETRHLTCSLTPGGLLTVELPFHLPCKPQPSGPNVFPIDTRADGRRILRVVIPLGSEYTYDDVNVECSSETLVVSAGYNVPVGKYGSQLHERQFRREYRLPAKISAESATFGLTNDGHVVVSVLLEEKAMLVCTVTAQDVPINAE